MITGSLTIDTFKDEVENVLIEKRISYETDFQHDHELGGYCYSITTQYASSVFSDSTEDGEIQIFVLDNAKVNYALDEGLTEEQKNELPYFLPVSDIYELLEYLTTQKLKPLRI